MSGLGHGSIIVGEGYVLPLLVGVDAEPNIRQQEQLAVARYFSLIDQFFIVAKFLNVPVGGKQSYIVQVGRRLSSELDHLVLQLQNRGVDVDVEGELLPIAEHRLHFYLDVLREVAIGGVDQVLCFV